MKKQLIDLAIVSVVGHVFTGVVIYAQHRTILRYKQGYTQIFEWSKITQEMLKQHFDNGGTLLVNDKLINKLDAFEIFLNNDML